MEHFRRFLKRSFFAVPLTDILWFLLNFLPVTIDQSVRLVRVTQVATRYWKQYIRRKLWCNEIFEYVLPVEHFQISNLSFLLHTFHCFDWIFLQWSISKFTEDGLRHDWSAQTPIPEGSFDKWKIIKRPGMVREICMQTVLLKSAESLCAHYEIKVAWFLCAYNIREGCWIRIFKWFLSMFFRKQKNNSDSSYPSIFILDGKMLTVFGDLELKFYQDKSIGVGDMLHSAFYLLYKLNTSNNPILQKTSVSIKVYKVTPRLRKFYFEKEYLNLVLVYHLGLNFNISQNHRTVDLMSWIKLLINRPNICHKTFNRIKQHYFKPVWFKTKGELLRQVPLWSETMQLFEVLKTSIVKDYDWYTALIKCWR